MQLKDIKPKTAVKELVVTIGAVDEVKEVRDGSLKIQTLNVFDETGQAGFTLWNDECNKFNVGEKIKLTKGWAGEYQNKLSLSSGKFGKIEKVVDNKPQIKLEGVKPNIKLPVANLPIEKPYNILQRLDVMKHIEDAVALGDEFTLAFPKASLKSYCQWCRTPEGGNLSDLDDGQLMVVYEEIIKQIAEKSLEPVEDLI